MDALNPSQLSAVRSEADTIYVIAGPGSGKTKTMVERIKFRIANGADPRRMAVITFTNAGAGEFTKRLEGHRLGYAGTLHGYCLRLLQQHGHLIGYRKGGVTISILPEKEREEMVKAARAAIGMAKRVTMKQVMDGKDGIKTGPWMFDVKLVWQAYNETLKRNNMVDYDKLLTEGLRLLRLDAVRSSLRFDELYVDEAQDSGATDWDFYEEFPASNKFIIGDTDQSCYSFRGARPECLTARARQSPSTIILDRNYRSGVAICGAASKLIAYNVDRVPKVLIPTHQSPGHVEHRAFMSDAEETSFAFARFFDLRRTGGHPYSEMAFLARTNAVAEKARKLLPAFGLPLKRAPKTEPPHGWQRALLSASVAIDPANDLYVAKLLTSGTDGSREAEKLRLDANIQKKSLAEYIHLKTPQAIDELPLFMAANRVDPEAVAAVHRIIATLPTSATMPDLLQAMYQTESFATDEGEQDGVTVSTIHGAKGREWDIVIVAGCEEGTLPLGKAGTDIEEERRLMFVAMTRARHVLILTSVRKRTGEKPWELRNDLQPSRFLAEIV